MSDTTPIALLIALVPVAWLALGLVICWQVRAERKRDRA